MADLTQTLIAAMRADRSAEARLQEAVTNNYPETAKALVAEIGTDGKPIEARQMASIFFKNTLNAKSHVKQNELHDRWKHLDPSVRQTIKDMLLNAMRSPDPHVAKFAAIAASEVACVELPYGEWTNFVQSMTDTIKAPDAPEGNKHACLECLGITCERISEVQEMLTDVPDLPDATVNAMLNAIVQGVQNDNENLRLIALQALNKSLNFVHRNMEVQQERDFIIRNALCGAAQSPNSQVRKLAFASLDLVAELYYDKLQDYMTQIYELTMDKIQNDTDEEVKKAAIEFWCTVAETEAIILEEEEDLRIEGQPLNRAPCNKYTESAAPTLVPVLLQTLSQQSEDFDEYGLADSGAICLESFSACIKDPIVQIVVPFVQQHITSDNWHMRDAAITAFTGILDGPSTNVLGTYVQQSITVLMGAFNDPNELVRDSATNCISIICKNHLQAVQMEQVHAMLQGLIQKLIETPRLASRASTAIFNIGTTLKSSDIPETNVLSAPMLPLLQALLQAVDRNDASENNLRIAAMSAAAEIIAASARDSLPMLQELIPVIVTKIQAALKIETLNTDERDNKDTTLGLLAGLLTVLFQRLDTSGVVAHSDNVMQAILQILTINNAICHEEAFMTVGAIATSLEADFNKYLQAFMPFLINALNNHQEHQLYIVSVGVVVDICAAVGGLIQPYCDGIMSALTECLKDGAAHRDTKPVVLSCIGDIAMAIGRAFEPYLQVSCMLLMQAAQAPIQPDDDDLIEFINTLRHSVLEAYVGIIMGLVDGQVIQMFIPYVNPIMQFLQYLSTSESYKDDLCLQKAVALIGDIGQQMGSIGDNSIQQQIRQPFIISLIQEALNSSDEQTKEIASWTRQVIGI